MIETKTERNETKKRNIFVEYLYAHNDTHTHSHTQPDYGVPKWKNEFRREKKKQDDNRNTIEWKETKRKKYQHENTILFV